MFFLVAKILDLEDHGFLLFNPYKLHFRSFLFGTQRSFPSHLGVCFLSGIKFEDFYVERTFHEHYSCDQFKYETTVTSTSNMNGIVLYQNTLK